MAKTVTQETFEGLSDAELNAVRSALVSFSASRALTAEERKAMEVIRKVQAARRLAKAAKDGVDLLAKLVK